MNSKLKRFMIAIMFLSLGFAAGCVSQQPKVQAGDGSNLELLYTEDLSAGKLYCYKDKTVTWTQKNRVYAIRGNNGSGSVSAAGL